MPTTLRKSPCKRVIRSSSVTQMNLRLTLYWLWIKLSAVYHHVPWLLSSHATTSFLVTPIPMPLQTGSSFVLSASSRIPPTCCFTGVATQQLGQTTYCASSIPCRSVRHLWHVVIIVRPSRMACQSSVGLLKVAVEAFVGATSTRALPSKSDDSEASTSPGGVLQYSSSCGLLDCGNTKSCSFSSQNESRINPENPMVFEMMQPMDPSRKVPLKLSSWREAALARIKFFNSFWCKASCCLVDPSNEYVVDVALLLFAVAVTIGGDILSYVLCVCSSCKSMHENFCVLNKGPQSVDQKMSSVVLAILAEMFLLWWWLLDNSKVCIQKCGWHSPKFEKRVWEGLN